MSNSIFSIFLIGLNVCTSREPAEAAPGADHLHPDTARHPGVVVRQDALPGHLHEGGGGAENQPARVQSAGETLQQQHMCTFLT